MVAGIWASDTLLCEMQRSDCFEARIVRRCSTWQKVPEKNWSFEWESLWAWGILQQPQVWLAEEVANERNTHQIDHPEDKVMIWGSIMDSPRWHGGYYTYKKPLASSAASNIVVSELGMWATWITNNE